MKKVLITGISGFAGWHLREYLESLAEVSVFGTDLHRLEMVKDRDNIFSIDLTKRDLVEDLIQDIKPDIVFHLAALASPAQSFEDPFLTFSNNIKAEINLLEAVRRHHNIAKILIVGSGDEYGAVCKNDNPIDEDYPMRPTSPYAVSKIAQDYLGYQYFLSYNLKVIRVRPFNHIGARQSPKFVVSAFSKQIAEIEAKTREPIIKVGNLSAIRDFSDVSDMVRAYWLAINSGQIGDVYNIGTGIGHSMEEILNILLSLSAKKIRIQIDHDLFRPSDNPVLICNCDKFQKITGWKPTIELNTTLKSVLNYWRTNI
jgi:GDP-4-dehydro-6-deoxy-D-mannose reductase